MNVLKMYTAGEEYSVKIEKMLYGGAGLARINSVPVFVKNSAPGDILKIKITKVHNSYLEGGILEITEPSKYRVKPLCALAKVCGSCDWQHIEYSEQLNQKKLIIKETFKQIAGLDVNIENIAASPEIFEYRCKVQLPYSQTPVSKRLLSGYYKKNSHELVNIKYCPLAPSVINEINEFLKTEAGKLNLTGYDEKHHKGLIRHVIYRISADLKQMLIIFVINSRNICSELNILSRILKEKYPVITGICADLNTKKTNVITSGDIKIISGRNFYIENINGIKYKISASSFFQVNPYCAALLFKRVKELIMQRIERPSILDAYSGVSSFGLQLSGIAGAVTCIEEVKSASDDAKENAVLNNADNLTIINSDAAKEFEKLVKSGVKFDVSITDPPRKGCTIEAADFLSKLTSKYIIYVSCSPASLARDVKLLIEKGFTLECMEAADMFPNTYHIETIAVLKKII